MSLPPSTPRRRLAKALALVVLVALAAAFVALLGGRGSRLRIAASEAPEPAAPSPRVASDEPAPASARAATCANRPPVLLEGRYVVSYRSRTEIGADSGGSPQLSEPAVGTFEGTLDAKPLPAKDGAPREVALQFAIRAADLSGLAEKLGAFGGGSLKDALSQPWTVSVDANGRLADARFTPSVPSSVQAMLHQVAEAAQLVWPADCDQRKAWEAEDGQLNGPVRASYTLEGDAVRKKLADEQVDGAYRFTASAALQLAEARIETLQYSSESKVKLAAAGQQVTVDSTLELRLRREAQEPVLALNVEGSSGLRPFDRKGLTDRVERAMERTMVGGRDVPALVAALESAGDELKARGRARGDLTAALRLNPALAVGVAGHLAKSKVGSTLERSLVEALVGAGTREADRVVLDVITDKKAALHRRTLAVMASGFTHVPEPVLSTTLALTAATEPALEVPALVAEATVIGTMTEKDPQAGAELAAPYLARAGQALPATEIGPGSGEPARLNRSLAWLQALGGLRSPTVLPLLERALGDEEPWVRASAIYSMRFHPTPRVLELVAQTALLDGAPGTREAAVLTCLELGRGHTLELVTKVLTTDEVAWVRLAAADVIGAWAIYRPGLRRVLEDALANEKDKTVRDALQKYITPGSGMEDAERVEPWSRSTGSQP